MVQREFEEYAKALADASRKQQQAEEVAEKKAEEERERRFQKKIADIVLRILHK